VIVTRTLAQDLEDIRVFPWGWATLLLTAGYIQLFHRRVYGTDDYGDALGEWAGGKCVDED